MDTASSRQPHTDRRVLRTRKAIRSAFIELLAETDFDKITITALAKRADVDRKTFYTHYASTEDLLQDYARSHIASAIEDLDLHGLRANPTLFCKNCLEALVNAIPLSDGQRRRIYEHIPVDKFAQYCTGIIRENLRAKRDESLSRKAQQRIDLVLEFMLGGIINAYIAWLSEDAGLSLDEAIDTISICAARGITDALGDYTAPA